jgi:hypothetical protein
LNEENEDLIEELEPGTVSDTSGEELDASVDNSVEENAADDDAVNASNAAVNVSNDAEDYLSDELLLGSDTGDLLVVEGTIAEQKNGQKFKNKFHSCLVAPFNEGDAVYCRAQQWSGVSMPEAAGIVQSCTTTHVRVKFALGGAKEILLNYPEESKDDRCGFWGDTLDFQKETGPRERRSRKLLHEEETEPKPASKKAKASNASNASHNDPAVCSNAESTAAKSKEDAKKKDESKAPTKAHGGGAASSRADLEKERMRGWALELLEKQVGIVKNDGDIDMLRIQAIQATIQSIANIAPNLFK